MIHSYDAAAYLFSQRKFGCREAWKLRRAFTPTQEIELNQITVDQSNVPINTFVGVATHDIQFRAFLRHHYHEKCNKRNTRLDLLCDSILLNVIAFAGWQHFEVWWIDSFQELSKGYVLGNKLIVKHFPTGCQFIFDAVKPQELSDDDMKEICDIISKAEEDIDPPPIIPNYE